MATVTVTDMNAVSSFDYRLRIEVDGEVKELLARRVGYHGDMPVIGAFEPLQLFFSLSLDTEQFRELIRIVVAVHSGRSGGFPVTLGSRSPA